MPAYRTGLLPGADLLTAALPCVRKHPHPGQKPLAAYLIFVSVFPVARPSGLSRCRPNRCLAVSTGNPC
jgi:hypothetical protein